MKGIVFTELLELVEQSWSLDMVDAVIGRAGVGGAYTAVGTYPHAELQALVAALAAETGVPVPSLLREFGKHLFQHFSVAYPSVFQGMPDCLTFLAGIEDAIHAQVRKLYPEAELPSFEVERVPGGLALTYYSEHPMVELAEGLIEGCIRHFGEDLRLRREAPPAGTAALARFIVVAEGSP